MSTQRSPVEVLLPLWTTFLYSRDEVGTSPRILLTWLVLDLISSAGYWRGHCDSRVWLRSTLHFWGDCVSFILYLILVHITGTLVTSPTGPFSDEIKLQGADVDLTHSTPFKSPLQGKYSMKVRFQMTALHQSVHGECQWRQQSSGGFYRCSYLHLIK